MRDRARALLLITLAVAALLNVGLALVIVGRPDEVRYGEAIIYEQAGRLLHGQALYQPLDQPPYSVTAYTPLYYWLAALLRVALGAGFGPGRALSFAAGLVAATLVGYLTWRRTRAVWPAAAATLLFLGLGLVGPIPWFASYKEDVLGLALSLGAVVALDRAPTPRSVAVAAVLAALAILTKQTLFMAALVGVVWLMFQRPRLAALFAALVGTLALAPLLVLEVTTHALLANTVLANINPFGMTVLSYNLVLLVLFQTAPVLVAAPYLVARLGRRAMVRDLLVLAWLASLLPVLGLAKEGADYNYWQLFAAVTAILAASATWERRERWSGAWSSLALALNAGVAITIIGAVTLADPTYIRPGAGASVAFANLVSRAHAEPRGILADPLDTSVLADRSIELEPVIYKLFYQVGEWDPAPIVSRVCSGEISMLVLGYPLGSPTQPAIQAEHQWPRPVLDALRHRLVLREVVPMGAAQRYVYQTDPDTACADAGGAA
ncbi:MAG TPA: hypothetical protein VF937_03550 [Chloroflexota bacterium]